MRLPLWRVAEFSGARGEVDQEMSAMGFSIDSRTVNPGEVFIAIKGERFDGHEYVKAAFENGAVAAIVQTGSKVEAAKNVLYVDDTLRALQSWPRDGIPDNPRA